MCNLLVSEFYLYIANNYKIELDKIHRGNILSNNIF